MRARPPITSRPGRIRQRLILTTALGCALALALAGSSQAATGQLLASITAANPEGCADNVGIAFDGHNLLVSCVNDLTPGHTQIDYINPANGSLVKSLIVPGHNGLAALSYDARRNEIWACDAPSDNAPATGKKLYLINPTTGSSTFQFTVAQTCWDGLAYDGTDDSLWMSADQSFDVYHYTVGGTLIDVYVLGLHLLGGNGNSGIAVGGNELYLTNADGHHVYAAPKSLASVSPLATEGQHLEGMACDPVTFAPKEALWVISGFSRVLNAYEIPAGSCGIGGLPPASPVAGRGRYCPKPSGRLQGTQLGPLALGFSRAHAHRVLPNYIVTSDHLDDFCLFGGLGIHAGYPSAKLLHSLPSGERTRVAGRIVLALTANSHYSLDGVTAGMRLAAAAHRLHLGKPFRILGNPYDPVTGGNFFYSNSWYIVTGASASGVLEVHSGIVKEIGIADKRLTDGRAAQSRLLQTLKVDCSSSTLVGRTSCSFWS
jgi:hypothetical protein